MMSENFIELTSFIDKVSSLTNNGSYKCLVET